MRAEPARPRVRSVSQGYLTTLGVRLLDGREFEGTDTATAPPVIVINRTVARRYFGASSPVGQFVDWYPTKGSAYQVQVVGVVEDVRNTTPDREAFPEVFVDYRQLLSIQQKWGDTTQQQDVIAIGFLSFAIRTRGDPASAIPAVGRIVRSVDPNAGVESILPMDRLVASNVARQRFYAVMLGVFVEGGHVILAEGEDLGTLVKALAAALGQKSKGKRRELVIALLENDARIEEVFADDDTIGALVEEFA